MDRVFLQHPVKVRACLNIDELANISFIPASTTNGTRTTLSRNAGPGNLFINYAMQYCTANNQSEDAEGEYAADGTIDQPIVDHFLDSHDYLHLTPPLHIAREMFGDHEAQRLIDECLYADLCDADTVATITRITAQNILKQYRRLLEAFFPEGQVVDELFICGPGARNANIVDYLETELPESVITRPLDDVGIPGDANEALCYAHLALEAVLGQATRSDGEDKGTREGADEEAVIARITCGENWDAFAERVRQFSGGKQLRATRDVKIRGTRAGASR
jgi:1,6-anhydro-N-acetylmuramate kinase